MFPLSIEGLQSRCKHASVHCCYAKGQTWVRVEIHVVQWKTCPLLSRSSKECEPRCNCWPHSPSSSSVLIQCHRQIYLHLLLLKRRSHNCPSCPVPLTFLRLMKQKKNFRNHSGHRRTTKIVAACLRRLLRYTCAWKRSSRSNFHTRDVQERAAGWKPVAGLKARWCICRSQRGGSWLVVEGEGVSRKSRSPPQCRGPVNLVNEEWATGQMTHPQSSINTAARGRQGHCYRWPRSPGSTGFRSIFGPAQLLLNGET